MNSSNTVKFHLKRNHLYPNDLFTLLDGKNRKMVIQSRRDPEKGFFVGKYLIEGINNFPQNTELGLKFLEDSMEKGSSDSLFYLCQLLTTKNDFIEADINKAIQLLQSYYDKGDPRYNYIYGLIYRKQRNDKKAFKCFQRSLLSGNSDAYFNYAEMLFYGNGCTKNKDKANEYFKMAKLNGCTKCDKYLTKNRATFQREIKSPYQKSADIVFLLDGTESMNRFIQLLNFSEFCEKLIFKLWDDFPKVYFRFGVVLYADTAVSTYISNEKVETVRVQYLTKRPSDIKRFLKNAFYFKGGYDGPEDWASGYESLVDKIEWDEKSEKIVVHIADSPGHGRSFSGDTFYSVPFFDKKNSKSMNQSIYDEIQKKEEEKFKNLIAKVASKGIVFFCLNLNNTATDCFNVTKDFYMKNNGKNFVIQNHFDVLDLETFQTFVSGAVSSCLGKDNESADKRGEKRGGFKGKKFQRKNGRRRKFNFQGNNNNSNISSNGNNDNNNSNNDDDDDDDDDSNDNNDSDFDYEYEINKFFNSDDDEELGNEFDYLFLMDEKNESKSEGFTDKKFKKKNGHRRRIYLQNYNSNDDDNKNSSDSDFDYEYEIKKFFKSDDDDEIGKKMIENIISMDEKNASKSESFKEEKLKVESSQTKKVEIKSNNSNDGDGSSENKDESDFDYEYEMNKFFNDDDKLDDDNENNSGSDNSNDVSNNNNSNDSNNNSSNISSSNKNNSSDVSSSNNNNNSNDISSNNNNNSNGSNNNSSDVININSNNNGSNNISNNSSNINSNNNGDNNNSNDASSSNNNSSTGSNNNGNNRNDSNNSGINDNGSTNANNNDSNSDFDYEYEINKFLNSDGDDELGHGFSDYEENMYDALDDELNM